MALKRLSNLMRRLKVDTSGNAMILVALGMPMLIGSSGLAVDVAQWYVWKRELQFATDQAALAGAWASAEPKQKANYKELSLLEFKSNLSYLADKVEDPSVDYADWNGGTDNTVLATASYSEALPFTSIFWGQQATVYVEAQASYQAATNYTTCLLALDPDAEDAFVLGGSLSGEVSCGVGALSNNVAAIRKDGQTLINVADLISAGGIDEDLKANGKIHEFISNLDDPFEGLTPPSSPSPQEYSCPETAPTVSDGSSTADVATRTRITYTYYQGSNLGSAKTVVTYTGTGANVGSDTTVKLLEQDLDFTPPEGFNQEVSDTTEVYTGQNWPSTAKKNASIYEYRREIITKLYTNVQPDSGEAAVTTGTANGLLPGTYGNITIGCNTTFNPGVYIITGTLDFGENHLVQGSNVLLVFTGEGSSQMHLNAKSKVDFTGITYDQLVNEYAVPDEDAKRMNGMIIYDPNSSEDIIINGGADVLFEGILYMPKRHVKFNGNSTVEGKCMMLAAGTIELRGNNTIKSLCLPTNVTSFELGGTTISVRLVA